MKKVLLLLISFMFVLNSNMVFSGEPAKSETEDPDTYHFPEIKPEFYGFMGYRFLNLTGSERAGEYDYNHSSAVIGGEIRAYPLPHRLHLEADITNKKDYFLDMGYAYGDLLLFRGINRTLFHNLENIALVDLNTTNTSPAVRVRDSGEKYEVSVGMSNLLFRLKTPDFPFHVYLDGRYFRKDGDIQQRFLGGSGSFTSPYIRTSQKKSIDWNAKDVTLGANSHIGPLEVDVSHGEKRFNSRGDRIDSEYYSAGNSRAAGTYPHNLVPDFKSSTNTIRLHTSYTGRLVAATTLSTTAKENKDSGAKADYFAGSIEVTYVPYSQVTLVARYRHKEADMDNPSSLPVGYLGYSSYTASTPGINTAIKESVSSKTDTFSGTARYRPFKGLGLGAEYTYEQTERKNAEEWTLTGHVIRKNYTLSANARPFKKLTLKLKYAYQDIDNPAYNTQPNKSNQASVSMTWTPLTWANAFLSYNIAKEKRYDVRYYSGGVLSNTGAQNRVTLRDKLLGSITFMPVEKVSFTTSYAYIHSKINEDIYWGSQLDRNVPYKDTAQSYAVNINYMPKKNISVNVGADYTKGTGDFYPGPGTVTGTSIASFSQLSVREVGYSIGSDYTLKGDWAVGLKYRYNSFRDMIDNPYDDATNGIGRVVLLTISKKW